MLWGYPFNKLLGIIFLAEFLQYKIFDNRYKKVAEIPYLVGYFIKILNFVPRF